MPGAPAHRAVTHRAKPFPSHLPILHLGVPLPQTGTHAHHKRGTLLPAAGTGGHVVTSASPASPLITPTNTTDRVGTRSQRQTDIHAALRTPLTPQRANPSPPPASPASLHSMRSQPSPPLSARPPPRALKLGATVLAHGRVGRVELDKLERVAEAPPPPIARGKPPRHERDGRGGDARHRVR